MRFSGVQVSQTSEDTIISIEFEYVGDETGDDQLIYTNNPSDIADASGRTLAAFAKGVELGIRD